MKNLSIGCILLIILNIIPFSIQAQDTEIAKKKIVNEFTNGVASALENFIDGDGVTEVQITADEDYHPEFSIMTLIQALIF
jgi:hypothetical protein